MPGGGGGRRPLRRAVASPTLPRGSGPEVRPSRDHMEHREHFRAALTADPAEIGAVRRAVSELAERGGYADRAGDLALALDELIANAQEHGRPPIVVTARVDGRLEIEVLDHGDGFQWVDVARTHPPAPLNRRGRGLWIVRQLVDHMEIESNGRGTIVRIEMQHGPLIGA